MGVKVITPATQQITTAELRVQSRADPLDTTEDASFVGWLAGAVKLAQHETGRSIGTQTLELALDAFPTACPIPLPSGPVTSITSIKYIDTAGIEQTLSSALYTLDDYGLQARAVLAYGAAWPATQVVANAVKVRYVAGDLDPAVKTALFLTVAHFYENREASTDLDLKELPLGAKQLLGTVKVWGV
jgi:uncharacterized phiE125 gp8 family phage protein